MTPAIQSAAVCTLLAATWTLAGPAFGIEPTADDPRIDARSGRLLATWPKDRLFDHIHMRLDLNFPDISKPEMEGMETLRVVAVGRDRSQIELDCNGPVVQEARVNNVPCEFSQEGRTLRVKFPKPLANGMEAEVAIRYTLNFAKNRGEGLTFSPGKPGTSSLTTQSTQIHAQGEAELNSKWFPCLDHPSEKLRTELVVTVEEGYEVVSNGRLVSKGPGPNPGRVRWHWVQDLPHSAYLVTLAVGKFGVVELGGPGSARPGLPMPVYTPVGTEDNVRASFANTPEMVAFFEQRFGRPYPWDQYAQVLVRDFSAGGMENTSCTLLTVGTSRATGPSQDNLISHELGHQWFGDLVTCKSWDHLWLNEGWASYCEALWNEHTGAEESPEKARAAYTRSVVGFLRGQRARNRGSAPEAAAMVSNRFTDPDKVFYKPDDPYSKGAMVLHMLRQRMGDDAFFQGTRLYLDRFAFKNAETDDFRRVMEEVSGQSLERFFDQWALRPGLARISVDEDWDEASSTLTVSLEQTQTVDALNPAYALTLPVLIKAENGDSQWMYIDMDTRSASASIKLAAKPTQVSVDPNVTLLASIKVEKELSMWIDEALRGGTIYARLLAVEHLRDCPEDAAQRALAAIVSDAGADEWLKQAAAAPLASARD